MGHPAISDHPSFLCLVRADAGQLRRALRPVAAEIAQRTLRVLQTAAFLEHQSYLFQSSDLSLAAPLGSPRQCAASLSDAARFRRSAAPAERLSGFVRAGGGAASMVRSEET